MSISEYDYRQMLARVTKADPKDSDLPGCDDEGELQDQIIGTCNVKGWVEFHSRMDKKTRRKIGELDFTIALCNGQTVYVEAKDRDRKITPEQLITIARLKKNQQHVLVVRSIEEFIGEMRAIEKMPGGCDAPGPACPFVQRRDTTERTISPMRPEAK